MCPVNLLCGSSTIAALALVVTVISEVPDDYEPKPYDPSVTDFGLGDT